MARWDFPRILLIMGQDEISCPGSQLTAAMGTLSFPNPWIQGDRSGTYTWSGPTSVRLLPVRDTWHFWTTVELEQSYFVQRACGWA